MKAKRKVDVHAELLQGVYRQSTLHCIAFALRYSDCDVQSLFSIKIFNLTNNNA